MNKIGLALFLLITVGFQVLAQTNTKLEKQGFVTLAEKHLEASKLEKEAEGKTSPSNPVFSNLGGAPATIATLSTTAVTGITQTSGSGGGDISSDGGSP